MPHDLILGQHRSGKHTVPEAVSRDLPSVEPDLTGPLRIRDHAAILVGRRELKKVGSPRKGHLRVVRQQVKWSLTKCRFFRYSSSRLLPKIRGLHMPMITGVGWQTKQ